MPGDDARPILAIVEVTRARPWQPEYHAYTQLLNGRAESVARAAGWNVVRLAAEDLGRSGLLVASDAADAVAIMGGEDIGPELYGGSSGYPAEGRHTRIADDAQIALVRRTIARGLPYLGVCRGLQILNVALEGTLVQDLGGESIHKNVGAPVERLMHTHDVAIRPNSALRTVLGEQADVQSAHHQAIDRLGTGLVPVAWAPDGVIEAVELVSAPVHAVQWHPEDPGSPAGQLESILGLLSVEVGLTAPDRSSRLSLLDASAAA